MTRSKRMDGMAMKEFRFHPSHPSHPWLTIQSAALENFRFPQEARWTAIGQFIDSQSSLGWPKTELGRPEGPLGPTEVTGSS